MIAVLAMALFLSALYCLWQHFTGLELVDGYLLPMMVSGYRAQSTISGFLTAAAIFTLGALFFVPQYVFWRGWQAIAAICVSALAFVGASLSYARSATIAMIAGVSVILWLLVRRLGWRLLAAPALAVILTAAVQPDVFYRFSREGPRSRNERNLLSKSESRWRIWSVALAMFIDHPLTGIGKESFRERHNDYMADQYRAPRVHAHNDLLHLAATRGILGVIAYLFLWLALGRQLWKYFTGNRGAVPILAAVGMVLIVTYLILGLFEVFFLDEETRLTIVFLLALVFSAIKLRKTDADQDSSALQHFP